MQHAVVTGAAGFIGSHVSEALLAAGWRVTGIDSFDAFYEPQVKRRNIAGCLKNDRFLLVEADIRDAGAMDRAVSGGVDVCMRRGYVLSTQIRSADNP